MVSPGSLPNLNVSTSCDSGGGGGGGSVYKPSTDVYIVQGEIQTLLAAMKRGSTRFSTHHHHSTSQHLVGGQHGYSDDQHTLITNLVQLNQKLNSVSSLAALHPMAFLNPFLDVIRAEFTSGPVTSAALHSLCKMLTFGLVISSSKDVSSVVENIADAVTHARFVGTEPGADEVVLMRILHVLRTLILSSVGIYLTNESVCEIMQSCFRVCFEVRLSELLRTNAEQTLTDIMQLLFSRIPEFVENEKVSVNLRRLNMRAGGVESSMGRSGRKKRGSRAKGGHHKESAGGRAAEKKETHHAVDVKEGGAVPLENVEVENKTHTTTRSSEDADISDDTTKFDELSGHEHGNTTVTDEGEKERVEDSVEVREGEEIEESVREDVEESVAVHVLSDGGGVERGDVMLEVDPPLEAVATNTESGNQDGEVRVEGAVAEGGVRVEGGAVVEAGVRVEVADASSPPFSMSRRPGHELVRPVSPFTMDDDDDDGGEGGGRRHPSIILQPPCEDHHHHTASPRQSPTHSPIVILTHAERVQPSSQGSTAASDMHQPIPILVDPTILGHPEQTSTSSQPDTNDNSNRRQ